MEADVTANPLKLRLYALEDINGDVLFALGAGRGSSLRGDGRIKGQNLKLPRYKDTHLEFKLKDETDRDLEFKLKDETDRDPEVNCSHALWVQQGMICPQKACAHSALQVEDCWSHKLVLRYDGTKGPFAFALRLVDEDGHDYLFDPIIINDEN